MRTPAPPSLHAAPAIASTLLVEDIMQLFAGRLSATARFDGGWRWFQRLFHHALTLAG
jgi:hypothetical protein